MGRETIYTEALHQALLATIRGGATERVACEASGISWNTWSEWKRRIRKGDRFHDGIAALIDDVPQAVALRDARITAQLKKHAERDYRAAVWLLERDEKRRERTSRLKLLEAEIELARLKIKAGGVERHELSIASPKLAAQAAREVFGSPSALENHEHPTGTSSVASDALPVPDPLDH